MPGTSSALRAAKPAEPLGAGLGSCALLGVWLPVAALVGLAVLEATPNGV
jgi:hypothetical protein